MVTLRRRIIDQTLANSGGKARPRELLFIEAQRPASPIDRLTVATISAPRPHPCRSFSRSMSSTSAIFSPSILSFRASP
jgi:hypothetical protein